MGFQYNPLTGFLDLVGGGVPAGTVSSSSIPSTDNAVARFDGTTGVIIQDSSVTIDDSGIITSNGNVDSSLTASRAVATNGSKRLVSSATTATELGYLSGVTSAIQTQLASKQSTTLTSAHILVGNVSNIATDVAVTGDIGITNAGLTSISSGVIVNADVNASAAIDYSKLAALTANRALQSDGSGFVSASSVTATELGYVSGVTSAIQTQLNNKQASGNYFVLDGVSGGQIANGGLDAGDNLTLHSTAHATKGNINLGSSKYDEVNNRLGLRRTPTSILDVYNSSDAIEEGSLTLIGQADTLSSSFNFYAGASSLTVYNRAFGKTFAVNNQGRMTVGVGAFGHPDAIFLAETHAGQESIPVIAVKKHASQTSCPYTYFDTDEVTQLWCVEVDGTIHSEALTASRALTSNGSKQIVSSATTATELGYVSGVTSAIQTQLDGKALSSAGDIAETSFTAADNQVAAANVTGLAFANGTVRSADILLSVVRGSTYAQYKINIVQGASSWYINQSYVGDVTGLTFTVTSAGQIQYVSTSTGSAAAVKFRAITTSA